jgi:hypothetical protein
MKINYEKTIAGFMAALLTVMPVAFAATSVSNAFGSLGASGSLDAVVVVGSGAAASDVAGAADIAVRLAELSYNTVSTTGGSAVDGLLKDGVGICIVGGPTPTVAQCGVAVGTNPFPASGVLKTFHYSTLKQATFAWKGNDYDFYEDVDLATGGVTIRHDLNTNLINGTPKVQIDSGDIIYEYVFNKLLNGTGDNNNKNYTYPVYIQMLGKTFAVVSTNGDNTITVLAGSIGTASATSGVTYGDYTAYSDLGSDNSWARVIFKDKSGNTVDTKVISKGDSYDSSITGLTLKVTAVKALQDGTIVGVDVTMGPKGTAEKTYDTTADVTSTGTSSDLFPGATDWGLQVGSGSFPAGTAGSIPAGSKIQVVYKPSSTVYLGAGQKVSLPNNYADFGFIGYNTDKWATITIAPLASTVSAYNYSATTQSFGSLYGFEITTDVGNSLVAPNGNAYDKAYVLFNASYGTPAATGGTLYPIMFGWYDKAKQKIIVNGTFDTPGTSPTVAEYVSKWVNVSATNVDNATYAFKLNYGSVGEVNYYLNVTINPSIATIVSVIGAGNGVGSQTINMTYQNKTVWTSSAPQFRLGATASSAEAADTTATTEAQARQNAGNLVQDVLDDSGIILKATQSYGASDKVVISVPAKATTLQLYFGKLGASTSGGTVKQLVPVKSSLAVLDTEVTAAQKAKNMVVVGGPCVNSVVADLASTGKFKYSCSAWPGRNFGYISVIDGAYTTGKVVVVIAGTTAADSRLASTVFQQYDSLLSGRNETAVEVTAATSAGITAG